MVRCYVVRQSCYSFWCGMNYYLRLTRNKWICEWRRTHHLSFYLWKKSLKCILPQIVLSWTPIESILTAIWLIWCPSLLFAFNLKSQALIAEKTQVCCIKSVNNSITDIMQNICNGCMIYGRQEAVIIKYKWRQWTRVAGECIKIDADEF